MLGDELRSPRALLQLYGAKKEWIVLALYLFFISTSSGERASMSHVMLSLVIVLGVFSLFDNSVGGVFAFLPM